RGPSGLRGDRGPACDGPVHGGRRAGLRARGRRATQRARQGGRLGVRRRTVAACGSGSLRQRPSLLRARAEGGGGRLPRPRGGRRALEPRRRACDGPRDHSVRLRARRRRQRLHRGVADHGLTGVLLVGGASARFGSPKALARLGDETLAERAWRLLGEVCEERIAVLEDGLDVRAPIAGVVAGLRAASHEISLIVPVDVPLVTAGALRRLAGACRDAAVPPRGPLPGAYRRTALPALELALAEGRLALRGAL